MLHYLWFTFPVPTERGDNIMINTEQQESAELPTENAGMY
jgi:hypothetical protein